MKDLVTVRKGEVLTDSQVVARFFEMEHNKLTRIIRGVIGSLGELKQSKAPPYYKEEVREYRGRKYTAYLMDRRFFSLLMFRVRGATDSNKVFEWQVAFNDAFYDMESALEEIVRNKGNDKWIASRQQGKIARRKETDAIKEFVDYAIAQGSENAPRYYKIVTNATYKALGVIAHKEPAIRDQLSIYDAAQLLLMENFVTKKLRYYMDLERHYKDIYKCIKEELMAYAKSIDALAIPVSHKEIHKG